MNLIWVVGIPKIKGTSFLYFVGLVLVDVLILDLLLEKKKKFFNKQLEQFP